MYALLFARWVVGSSRDGQFTQHDRPPISLAQALSFFLAALFSIPRPVLPEKPQARDCESPGFLESGPPPAERVGRRTAARYTPSRPCLRLHPQAVWAPTTTRMASRTKPFPTLRFRWWCTHRPTWLHLCNSRRSLTHGTAPQRHGLAKRCYSGCPPVRCYSRRDMMPVASFDSTPSSRSPWTWGTQHAAMPSPRGSAFATQDTHSLPLPWSIGEYIGRNLHAAEPHVGR